MRDGAPVVPVGRRDQRQRSERRQRAPQIVEVAPLGLAPESTDQKPIHRPRCAENLEGGQPEAVRLVLHGERHHVELGGEGRRVDDTRRCIAGEAPVELRGRRVGACRAPVVPAAGIDEELWDSWSHRRSSLGPISRECNGSRVDILLKRRGR